LQIHTVAQSVGAGHLVVAVTVTVVGGGVTVTVLGGGVAVTVLANKHTSAPHISRIHYLAAGRTLSRAVVARLSIASVQVCCVIVRWYGIDNCGEEQSNGEELHLG
jgi:hypothetical protein